MADGNLVRQSGTEKGAVVFGPSVYDAPLLPYEKQLIKTIGITEEEYRWFTAEARRRGSVRPAEYDHIPDIHAGGFGEAFLISLAVSLVMTGVSYLLTPKPKMPEASKRSQLDLGSTTGANRFTPSRGFETLNELADYASPIPIIFGLYDDAEDVGGMLITPKLVWSRVLSHGTQQSAKLMFVVGEQGVSDGENPDGIAPPELEGIFLGNNALDAVYEDFFAFYWKRDSTVADKKRIRRSDRVHGTNKGDPANLQGPDSDAFLVPDNERDLSKSFSHAYSPVNSVRFGVYGAIPNGTGYRVNYEVVSIIQGDDRKSERQQAFNLTLRRMKIVGDKDFNVKPNARDDLDDVRKQDMRGEGRQYSPRMGLVQLREREKDVNGKMQETNKISIDDDFAGKLKKTVKVKEGDHAIFKIHPSKIDEDKYQRKRSKGGENVDDINSTVESEQIAADQVLQIGEQFAIGGTKWIVKKRSLDRYDPDNDETQFITLECVDVDESSDQRIGLVSNSKAINPAQDFITDGFEGESKDGIDPEFFPLTRVATGFVRNNRPVVVTEVGLRSRVFQRLNGICAFNTLPTPAELEDFDKEEVQVRSGTYTGTIMKASAFQVFVRKAGRDKDNNRFEFKLIDLYFVVRGTKPVDQYNFIRFTHPQNLGPSQLEYKFVAVPGSELRALPKDQAFINLSASIPNDESPIVQESVKVPGVGTFEVEAAGYLITKQDISRNKEFIRKPRTDRARRTLSYPQSIKRKETLPDTQKGTFIRAAAIQKQGKTLGNVSPPGLTGAFTYEIMGNSDDSNEAVGGRKRKQTKEIIDADKNLWIIIGWTFEKYRLGSSHYARANNNQRTTWIIRDAEVVASSYGFRKNDVITIKRGLNSTAASGSQSAYGNDNPFKNNHPDGTAMRFSGFKYKITDVVKRETAGGRVQAFYHEIFGSARKLKVGEKKSVFRTIQKGSKSIKLKLTATVRSTPNSEFGRDRGWNHPEKIEVKEDSDTTSNWNKGDCFDDVVSIDINNPYYTVYDKVGFQYVVNNVKEIPRQVKVTGETIFEKQSQYADLSFYRGLVQKSNESEPEHTIAYVNEIMPNEEIPVYENLTIAGLALKASRNFTSLDQLRCWIPSGLHVKRLHPGLNKTNGNPYAFDTDTFKKEYGPSNLFTDLVYYLLTDQVGGAGALMNMTKDNASLLEVDDFTATSRFLFKQKLFFNGAIVERTNLRQYITEIAPYFLCNFVLTDGKFSLKPAIPVFEKSGEINTGEIEYDHLFTAGNILEDSYKLEFLRSEERRPFKAVMRYRKETRNQLPEEKVVEVTLKNDSRTDDLEALPEEQFDLTQFCTSEDHAVMVAKYFLALRRHVTHTISFSTTVHGLELKAGSYIKVVTASSPYSPARTGTVSSTGVVTSVEELEGNKTYDITYFKSGSDDIQDGQMTINSDGTVKESEYHDVIFSIKDERVNQNIYVVEQLTFSQEGTVDIVASEHPCDDEGTEDKPKLVSKIAKLVSRKAPFEVEDA
jgi:hypothetical protein